LLSGQEEDGGFGGDPYRKWTGAHWRLVAMAELDAPADDPRVATGAGSAPAPTTPSDRRRRGRAMSRVEERPATGDEAGRKFEVRCQTQRFPERRRIGLAPSAAPSQG